MVLRRASFSSLQAVPFFAVFLKCSLPLGVGIALFFTRHVARYVELRGPPVPRAMPVIPSGVVSNVDLGIFAAGGAVPRAVFVPWIAMHVNGKQSCWCRCNFAVNDPDVNAYKRQLWISLRH